MLFLESLAQVAMGAARPSRERMASPAFAACGSDYTFMD